MTAYRGHPRDEANSPVTEAAREAWRTPGFQSPPASWRDSVDATPPDAHEAEEDRS